MINAFAVIYMVMFSVTCFAQSTLIKAQRYLDVKTGVYVSPANILIQDGKIQAINPISLPKQVTIINKPDLTLLPGLMDMHVHLPLTITKMVALEYVQTDAAMATILGVKNARTLLMAGFTTVRNLGQIYPGETFVDVALSKASEQGLIEAPHIIPAGHALSITGGHMDPDMVGQYAPGVLTVNYKNGVADGVDEIVKSVRYQIKHGAQVIKAAATAGVISYEPSVGAQQYSYRELKAMVDEAKRHGVFVAVHAHGADGINAAIKAGVRSIEHGSLLTDESIELMKQHGTYLVPTTYLADGINLDTLPLPLRQKAERILPQARENLKKAIQAKVKIAFGTDSAVLQHGENAKEFSALVRRGMTPIEAIQTATVNAADLMAFKDRGQIQPGMLADMIGVKGDPLQTVSVLEKVDFVMKSGKVYKSS
jgi:imidazolonepropionase-like amidohydrolase